jgi:hypothetical protein
MLKVSYHIVKEVRAPMLPWIHSIRRVHDRSSHEYLRVVTVRGEGNGETVVTTPDRLDWFRALSDCMFKYRRPMGECLFHI